MSALDLTDEELTELITVATEAIQGADYLYPEALESARDKMIAEEFERETALNTKKPLPSKKRGK